MNFFSKDFLASNDFSKLFFDGLFVLRDLVLGANAVEAIFDGVDVASLEIF